MCSRFVLNAPPASLLPAFGIVDVVEFAPRYNIAPSQKIAVVALKRGTTERTVAYFSWGLSSEQANNHSPRPINARAETLLEKPLFREAFLQRRCLIPANGFVEWETQGRRKIPYQFRLRDQACFAFAGIWSLGRDPKTDQKVGTTCMITTNANDLIRRIHERMPVILLPESYSLWLDPKTPASTLQSLLIPYPAEEMEAIPISPRVNSSRYDDPACLEPPPPDRGLFDEFEEPS